ncbi:metabolite traffic protein EboE [Sciscionella sediminilitoris]|uniref:metabolite traffic protein EboE n=1 Tax=Sciscionella sediminilitoris TaxID=1445613 RepID=UPI0004DF268D|nr:metabolite traffic protein EboE [Sciscionella sp. SE31]
MSKLCYCTNVHPAEDLPGILEQLDRYSLPVRHQLGADRLGLGLWLAAGVAEGLAADPAAVRRFRGELDARGLDVLTLNAFPYGGFHRERVRHDVYRPAWTEQARVRYTANCATVLAGLLADDARAGSISTLPLGWRTPWTAADDASAAAGLTEAARACAAAGERAGRPIRLAVEPEPGCVLDTVADAVDWLAGRVDPELVGICLDTCHLAVSWADPSATVASIADAGLRVAKVQASAALEVPDPMDPAVRDALAEFAEGRYLHQVRERSVGGADDLADALGGTLPGRAPWRVHFHVPLHARPRAPLRATTEVIETVLGDLDQDVPVEVETYTWSVLPRAHREPLVPGIAAELAWAGARLSAAVPR